MNEIGEIRKRSERNLKAWREEIGPEASALVPGLIEQHAPCKSFVAYHTTDPENFDAITKSGFIYSYEKLQEMNLAHKEGWTIGENKFDDAFKNAVHEADAHQDHVYMRPLLGSYTDYDGKTGFCFDMREMPPDHWISFYDNNFIHLAEISASCFGTLHKGFSTDDVFTGDSLPEAVTLKALKYILDASRRAELGKLLEPLKNSTTKSALAEIAASNTHGRRDLFSVLQYLSKAEHARLKWPEKIGPEILQDPEFTQMFNTALNIVHEDLADNGQVAFPDKVSISKSVMVHGGSVKRLPTCDQPTPAPPEQK